MSLLAASAYAHLFDDLADKSVGFVTLDGNAADLMIQYATRSLFDKFGIDYYQITESELDTGVLSRQVDEIVISGGGNMGTLWSVPFEERMKALDFGLPVTVFPQSFTRNDEETDCYKKVFVREAESRKYNEKFILAPDMAFAMNVDGKFAPPVVETGLFLRRDRESYLAKDPGSLHPAALVDPVLVSKTIDEYLGLASMFKHIITDRLHFAIAGLMTGREVTLLPNSYHKNRSIYETWLADLGCLWLEDIDSINYDRAKVEPLLWKRLGGVPSEIFDWDCSPEIPASCISTDRLNAGVYLSSCREYEDMELATPGLLYSLLENGRTIEDAVMMIYKHFPGRLVSAALDLQTALRDADARYD